MREVIQHALEDGFLDPALEAGFLDAALEGGLAEAREGGLDAGLAAAALDAGFALDAGLAYIEKNQCLVDSTRGGIIPSSQAALSRFPPPLPRRSPLQRPYASGL